MPHFQTRPAASAVFDEPNLVSAAGRVPLMALARRAGLAQLGERCLSVPRDKGTKAGVKITSLVAGMATGADSIDDLAVLSFGGTSRVLGRRPRRLGFVDLPRRLRYRLVIDYDPTLATQRDIAAGFSSAGVREQRCIGSRRWGLRSRQPVPAVDAVTWRLSSPYPRVPLAN